jgi:hypothetical protein
MSHRDSDHAPPAGASSDGRKSRSRERTDDALTSMSVSIIERLERIESMAPSWATIAERLDQIVGHLVPPAADIVGSKYVAERLGCSTTWVGRMATNGMIPASCIVSGTGQGRLWKFHRRRVEEWLVSR